jgi:hypothetical protein
VSDLLEQLLGWELEDPLDAPSIDTLDHALGIAVHLGSDESGHLWGPVALVAAGHVSGDPLLDEDLINDDVEGWARHAVEILESHAISARSLNATYVGVYSSIPVEPPDDLPRTSSRAVRSALALFLRRPLITPMGGNRRVREHVPLVPGILGPTADEDHLTAPVRRQARPKVLTEDEASATVAAFEFPIAALVSADQNGQLDDWHGEFVRNTLQQIALWRQRPDANPQIFELLVADLVRQLLAELLDTSGIRSTLIDLGADDATASDIVERLAATINDITTLGGNDDTADASAMNRIADAVEQMSDDVAAIADKPGSQPERLRKAVAKGAATETGKYAAGAALSALGHLVMEHRAQIQVGLLMAWRSVRDLWLR